MIYFFSLFFIGLALYEKNHTKFLFNPLSLFLLEWSVILICSDLHLYGLNEVNSNTYTIFIVGIIFFVVGYLVQSRTHIRIKQIRHSYCSEYEPQYRLLIILAICCLAYYILCLLLVVQKLNVHNLWAVQQYLRKQDKIISNQWLRAMGAFIFDPISFSLPIISTSDIWFGQRNKPLILITMVMLIVQMLATASRMTLLLFVIYIFLIGMYKLKKIKPFRIPKLKKKIQRLMRLTCCIGILAFIIMSLSRNLSLLKGLYLQISIPPLMYEIWSEEVKAKSIYGFGEASLNGFLFPILYFLQKLFFAEQLPANMEIIYNLINLTDSKWVMVGNNITANAYVSIFWFLYTDARYIGIVVGMFLFGIYAAKTYTRLEKNTNCKTVCNYCICIVAVLFTLVRMQFGRANFCLAIMFIHLIGFRRIKAT